MITHTGGCHCGRVRFEIVAPAHIEVTDCNCSICKKSGYLHLTVTRSQFKLLSGADVLTTYQFNTGKIVHQFCSKCGVEGFASLFGGGGKAVNVRTLDEVELDGLSTMPFDGASL